MNFLAHFHVGPHEPDPIAGAFLGDFVRGRIDDQVDLPPNLRKGIHLHRHVDAWTDRHPIWRRSASHLPPERRRLAGIIIDVIYDHFLCRHWEEFNHRSLEDFAELCYTSLLSRTQFMPPEARRIVRRMQEYNWLPNYFRLEGMARTFKGLSYRSPALKGIELASADLAENYEAFETDFVEFYPELIRYGKSTWDDLSD